MYVSGVLGLDKDTMKLVPGGVEPEAIRALQNLGAVLEAANSNYSKGSMKMISQDCSILSLCPEHSLHLPKLNLLQFLYSCWFCLILSLQFPHTFHPSNFSSPSSPECLVQEDLF